MYLFESINSHCTSDATRKIPKYFIKQIQSLKVSNQGMVDCIIFTDKILDDVLDTNFVVIAGSQINCFYQ